MNASYRFSNVTTKGKNIAFTIDNVSSYQEALKKACNFIINKYNIPKSEFSTHLNDLKKNIENGYTNVTVQKKPEQGELNLEFDDIFNELYYGLINEVEEK